MSKNEIILVFTVIIAVLIILLVKESLTVQTVRVDLQPDFLVPDGISTVTINIVGVNRFGFAVPFKTLEVEYLFAEGKEKVSIVSSEPSKIILRSKFEPGNVVINIKSKYTIFPIKIEIPIIHFVFS